MRLGVHLLCHLGGCVAGETGARARGPRLPTPPARPGAASARAAASERCRQEKRKTITGDDVLWALATLGFDEYVEPLQSYLARFRDASKGAKGSAGAGAKDEE